MTHVQLVNGYVCFDCADVALAQKYINPAHPPGSPSNPTGNTPNGPYALNGASGVNGAQGVNGASGPGASDGSNGSGTQGGSSQNPNAFVFGGSLTGQGAGAGVSSVPPYQPGAAASVFA